MRSIRDSFKSAAGFVSGVLIGLAMITPVFAAATTGDESWGSLLIVASTVLLALGLMVRATTDIRRPAPVPLAAADVPSNRAR